MRTLILVVLLLSNLYAQTEEVKTFSKYIIKTGDILNIVVTPTEDISKEVTVQKDGNITIKLIGEIKAAGFTLNELASKIEKELAKYVTSPSVSVTLKEFGKRRIYVMGQAKMSGSYDYKEGIKILELLSLAGGFTNEADLTAVKIFRVTGEKRDVIEVNMEDVVKKGEVEKDIELQIDDIVYVPQTGVTGWNWFVNNIMPTLYLISTVLTLYLVVK